MADTDEAPLYELYTRLIDLPPPERMRALDAVELSPDLRARVIELLETFDAAPSDLPPLLRVSPGLADGFSAPDPLIGQRVGAYLFTERLSAEGGMGTVYRAERADGTYQQPVAIKVIRRGLDTDRLLKRFNAERHILARLNHPAVVKLLDAGALADGRPFFVMELVEGGIPLDEFSRSGRLGIQDRLRLFLKVCAAVEYAHRSLVVHRDLKPGNVLVTKTGEPKLLDFGLAKLIDTDEPDGDTLTRSGERFMTPEYASPEQVRGEPVLPASDVYSLGVMLYELLSGHRPYTFASRTPTEVERVVCELTPPRPSAALRGGASASDPQADIQVERQLRGDLDAIVLKALDKDSTSRYGSVEQLADDLRRHLDGFPVSANSVTGLYRFRKFVRRHRGSFSAAAAVFFALLTGVIVALWQATLAARARDDANARQAEAQLRFNDVRKLATSFIFEFHDAIADLSGATAARKMVLQKGLEYLDVLANNAREDESLRLELAEAYDRIGDIYASPFGSNLGDAQAGLASYEKATAIREPLVAASLPASATDVAYTRGLERRADGLFANGRVPEAVDLFRQVVTRYEKVVSSEGTLLPARQGLARSLNRLCVLLLTAGDARSALEACRKAKGTFDWLLLNATKPDAAFLRSVAMNEATFGNALRLTGDLEDAAHTLAVAVERLQELTRAEAANATLKQNLATVLTQYASTQSARKELLQARLAYQEAVDVLEGLYAADAANERLRAVLSFTLMRRSATLIQLGAMNEARLSTARSLALLRAQAERPQASPTDKNDYASALLTCEPPDLRRPAEALQFAKAAVSAATNAVYLDTLSLAYFQNGQRELAIETAHKALSLMPPLKDGEKPTALRAEVEGHLAMFKEAGTLSGRVR